MIISRAPVKMLCPYCGGELEYVEYWAEVKWTWYRCKECRKMHNVEHKL